LHQVIVMSKIVGVVYPIPLRFVDRLFVAHRNVFVKYVARTTNLRLAPKHRLVFYASHGSKEVVGEGIIEKVEFLTPQEALEKYADKVFLNEDELKEYTIGQPQRTCSKKMLAITLSRLRRYHKAIKYGRPLTMAGEYLTEEKYWALLKKAPKSTSKANE
jgi:hypothetical protein